MADISVTVQVDDIRDVFREVSPYITRQWKEVCRDLGVQDMDLNQLESESFSTGLSNLAYKGLCLWYDRARGTAKKARLTTALQRCGLRRAEEKIKNIEMKKLMVKSSPVVASRPSASRATSARRRIKSGHTSRPPSCTYANGKPRPSSTSRPPSCTYASGKSRPSSGVSHCSRLPTGNGNTNWFSLTSGSGCIAQPPVISRRYPLVAVRIRQAVFLGASSPKTQHSIPLSHIILNNEHYSPCPAIIVERQAGGEKFKL